ncbi:MAG: ribonucleoside reductase [Gammaproteobacteria bacterium HGW-Gammaproteobacteria-1]|nr:MAG: ribonucleoside reductase [Gammaproteobacteria bacterium HGW-Gammaproteobacteria-1]
MLGCMGRDHFASEISRHVWDNKYRFRDGGLVHDRTVDDTWRRVARALAAQEPDAGVWEQRFHAILDDFRFLPGGRILAGAGTSRNVTLFNCFVMGTIEDSLDGIFDALKQGALTMQQGGGVGYDFSTLRPAGTLTHRAGTIASGPVSFMRIWDSMCATLLSTGARRGAMMATLRCDHPDIEQFIAAKQDARELRHFNLSVLASDAFMRAVEEDDDWPLLFPAAALDDDEGEIVMRDWPGCAGEVPCRVIRRLPARQLWQRIMRATYDYAEPGVLFIDRINRENNLHYRERISATNPCVTADTWVHTLNGPRLVAELVGSPFVARVDSKAYPSAMAGFFATGTKAVFLLRSREGHTLRLTADHPIRKVTRMTRRRRDDEWVRLDELRKGDKVVVHNHRGAAVWPGRYGADEGYLMGLLVGDGTFSEGVAELRVWPANEQVNAPDGACGVAAVLEHVEAIVARLPQRKDFTGWRRGSAGYRYLRLAAITRIAKTLDICPGQKTVTPAVQRCSSGFYQGFLRGLFDADGSVQGSQDKGASVRLAQSDVQMLVAVQRMLLRLGIASTMYCDRRVTGPRVLTDGKGGKREYLCRADHELTIAGDNLAVFSEMIGFTDAAKAARLQSALGRYRRALNRERFVATIESIEPDGDETVFDVQIPGINAFDANGLYVHNCGEIPLPPYGACDLGSVNLTRFVREPFTDAACLDIDGVRATVQTAVRLMDNVIDASRFPLPQQEEQARGTRRIGLGLTGLADVLITLGLRYDSDAGRLYAKELMEQVRDAAYRTSVALAKEKGAFPFFDREAYLAGSFIRRLPADIRDGIAAHGIRNSHLTAIAPTGTISLLAGNISSGLEPVFDWSYSRRLLERDGSYGHYEVSDYAWRLWRELHGEVPLPPHFLTAAQLAPQDHLAMQAALQPCVDSAISKTINIPEDFPFEQFQSIYREAHRLGLKGCTTFRPNPVTGSVLQGPGQTASHCCTIEREAD